MFNTIQDLEQATSLIKTLISQNARVQGIYTKIREQERFSLIGDYPIISKIVSLLKEKSEVPAKEVAKVMRKARDGEFKTAKLNHPIVTDFCA